MTKEIAKVDQNYSNLYTKVDIIVDAVTKLVNYHTSLNSKEFIHLQSFLPKVKEMILKLTIPPTSIVSQESISLLLSSLESRMKVDIGPLINLVNLIPTAAPLVSIWVQGGDKGVGASKNSEQGKVVGKVSSTQIPNTFPVSATTTSTNITSKPLTKGVLIGSSVAGSSSKVQPSEEELKKGKGTLIESTVEEKKLALEQEMEKPKENSKHTSTKTG